MRQVLLQKCSETKTALHWLPCSNHIHGANERVDDAKNVVNAQANRCFTQHYLWQFFHLHLCMVFCKGDECVFSFSKPSVPDLQLRKSSRFSSIKRKLCHHGNLTIPHWKTTTKKGGRRNEPLNPWNQQVSHLLRLPLSSSATRQWLVPPYQNLEKTKQDERNKTWTAPTVLGMKDESIQQTTSHDFKFCAAGALLSIQFSLARGNNIKTSHPLFKKSNLQNRNVWQAK